MSYKTAAAFGLTLCCWAAATVPAAAVTAAPQVRRLVYAFTWGTTNTQEVHTSGMRDEGMASNLGAGGSESGIAESSGGASDKGTITVDVIRSQPDDGLVVDVSETAQDTRSAEKARCVVFGDTTVVCDSSKKINAEELALLRLLGSNFVDPNRLDAARHWQLTQSRTGYSSTADYTIAKTAGGLMTIDETGVVKDSSGARPETTNITTTIGYDFGRTIPTSINEYTILRSEAGENYNTRKSQIVLQLQSDTGGATALAP
jgi:co-chaperonin GroES (HSP10)